MHERELPRRIHRGRNKAALVTAVTTLGAVALGGATAGAAGAATGPAAAVSGHTTSAKPTVAYSDLALPDGAHATVWSDGLARITARDGRAKVQQLPLQGHDDSVDPVGRGTAQLPMKGEIVAALARGDTQPYAAGEVVVVYRSGVTASAHADDRAARTSSPALNAQLAALGVDRAQQLFTGVGADRLQQLQATAQAQSAKPVLDFAHAYRLHVTKASVTAAVTALRADPDVVYASPDWTVTTAHTSASPVPQAVVDAARGLARGRAADAADDAATSGIPDNFALTTSTQAMLNRPGVDAVPAFAAIQQKFHQLPGQGETITNVSLGTLDDASAVANPSDTCNFWATAYGPTTVVIGGQRYLDWPSMPLIPTYTADANGNLDPTGETCGDDPQLVEIGLDFSMMAPLPHELQRPGETGSGLSDLLGIAPGANYRLVVPSTPGGQVSDVDAAFLAAAMQNPRPNVITASLGFGYDAYGFPSRYLEDDPMTEAILAAIVSSYHMVVCVSAGDGLRIATNAPISATGGSAATQIEPPGGTPTTLGDVGFSTVPSRDFDSGAIDVGATTLDDIFSAPPQKASNAKLRDQHAFPEVRYNGARTFSSGFGSRVNVSAPGDNVISIAHAMGAGPDGIQLLNEGGTSASAPEVAAAAAVALQVARLTHNTTVSGNPLAVRDLLTSTGAVVPQVPQADVKLHVGPQVDVGNVVATLLAQAGTRVKPSVPRVAVQQRQQASALGGTIYTTTDPSAIPMSGRLAQAWLTIAPDWVGLPAHGVTYRLTAADGTVLGTNAWARLQPATILRAAGLSLASTQSRTVQLQYAAMKGSRTVAQTTVGLTFGPTDGTVQSVLAPRVPPVVRGDTIPVRYDIRRLTGATDPMLVVSQPGRIDPATGLYFRPAFTASLRSPVGTIDVPVSALQGAGIYGIGIQSAPGGWFSTNYSTYAFTRVAPPHSARAQAPLLSADGAPAGHYLEIPWHGSFRVTYDVRNVPGATGAVFEVSSGGPTVFNNWNPFNNPNGSIRDANGHDSGSVAFVPLQGTHGTATLDSATLGLYPSMNHVVRVLPVRFGAAAGEASDVSSLSMDGVRPSDGGSVANGFGVNGHGMDGFVTSNQSTASGGSLGSVQEFDQTSNTVSRTVAANSDVYATMNGGCAGLFHDDVGLFDDYNARAGSDTATVLDPVATGTVSGSWNVPDKDNGVVLCPAENQETPMTAFLTAQQDETGTHFGVFGSNIAKNTFTRLRSIDSGIAAVSQPTLTGFAENSSTGTAVVAFADWANYGGPPTIVQARLSDGKVTSFSGVTDGPGMGVAVDSATNHAITGSFNDFAVYDLGDGTGTRVSPGGSTYEHPAADSIHNEFLVQEIAPPDFSGETPNNNALSAVLVTDEQGNVLKRVEQFNFFNIYLLDMGDYLQVNPRTSTAYTLGVSGGQVVPFGY